MQEDMKYLRERVDSIADTLARNTVILERNTESLREHMRQTMAIERRVRMLEDGRKFLKWLVYIIGLLGTAAGAILAITRFFNI